MALRASAAVGVECGLAGGSACLVYSLVTVGCAAMFALQLPGHVVFERRLPAFRLYEGESEHTQSAGCAGPPLTLCVVFVVHKLQH